MRLTLSEKLELVVDLLNVSGAGAVLLPLVLPEGELAGVIVDIGPVRLQVREERRNAVRVKGCRPVAVARAQLAITRRPDPMHSPPVLHR